MQLIGPTGNELEAADAASALDVTWHPDWRGETCLIVAGGPSAKTVPLAKARGKARIIAVNEAHRIAPFADVLYACDYRWVTQRRGVPGFAGLKVTQDRHAVEVFPSWRRVVSIRGRNDCIFERPGYICWAGNSGQQAVNLAAQWGVARILLAGFDMSLSGGLHWHGAHTGGLTNPEAQCIERWRRIMDANQPILDARGVAVVNLSEDSALKRYPKMSLEEALGV